MRRWPGSWLIPIRRHRRILKFLDLAARIPPVPPQPAANAPPEIAHHIGEGDKYDEPDQRFHHFILSFSAPASSITPLASRGMVISVSMSVIRPREYPRDENRD